jgi:predicted GNAT family N-acyltransferase
MISGLEMAAQQLTALAALPEHLGSIHRTHVGRTTVNFSSRGSTRSNTLLTQTRMHAKLK